jgi:hypothetical protein
MNKLAKNFRGRHHFSFPVPLQADCCYFYGMAESRFLIRKPFPKQKPIEARK